MHPDFLDQQALVLTQNETTQAIIPFGRKNTPVNQSMQSVLCWVVSILQQKNKRNSTAQDFKKPDQISGESNFRCPGTLVSPGERNTDSLRTRPCYICQDRHALVIGRRYNR